MLLISANNITLKYETSSVIPHYAYGNLVAYKRNALVKTKMHVVQPHNSPIFSSTTASHQMCLVMQDVAYRIYTAYLVITKDKRTSVHQANSAISQVKWAFATYHGGNNKIKQKQPAMPSIGLSDGAFVPAHSTAQQTKKKTSSWGFTFNVCNRVF